jgi:hypothetical protein
MELIVKSFNGKASSVSRPTSRRSSADWSATRHDQQGDSVGEEQRNEKYAPRAGDVVGEHGIRCARSSAPPICTRRSIQSTITCSARSSAIREKHWRGRLRCQGGEITTWDGVERRPRHG